MSSACSASEDTLLQYHRDTEGGGVEHTATKNVVLSSVTGEELGQVRQRPLVEAKLNIQTDGDGGSDEGVER